MTKADETKTSMVDTDRKQYERYAAHMRTLGVDMPPYQAPPGGGTLGPADSSAQGNAGSDAAWKINNTYPDRLKKSGEILTYDPNDPFKRSSPSGPDYVDVKYWARKPFEQATDAVRHHYGLDYQGRHATPYPFNEDVGKSVKGLGQAVSAPISAVNNFAGVLSAGDKLHHAQDLSTDLDTATNGPANTGGIDWANSNGGGW